MGCSYHRGVIIFLCSASVSGLSGVRGSRKFDEIYSSGKKEELCFGGTLKDVEEGKMLLRCFLLGTGP